MKLQLAVRLRDPFIEVEATPFTLHMKDGKLRIVVPYHDDWGQTASYDLKAAEATVHCEATRVIVQFATDAARDEFKSWLAQTNEAVKEGYKTMCG